MAGRPYLHSRPSRWGWAGHLREHVLEDARGAPHWLHGAARALAERFRPTWLLRRTVGALSADVGAVQESDYERHVNRQRTLPAAAEAR